MPWRPQQHRPQGVTTKRIPRTKEKQREYAAKYDWSWREFSKRYLDEHPLCVDHLERGIVHPAREVHHLQKVDAHPELQYEMDNLMALCKACHSARTARGE